MPYFLIVAVSFLIMFGEHFVPFAVLAGRERLHNLQAYIIGTATVTAIQIGAIAVWPSGDAITVILVVVAAAGAGVIAGYGVDHWIETIRANKRLQQIAADGHEREVVLMEQRDEPR